jgi:hypothetical protein
MKSQDIVILLKILALEKQDWKIADIAESLKISSSTVFEALERNKTAKLIDSSKKKVLKGNLLDFLLYGVKYVFPVEPSRVSIGIPTAHSAPPLADKLVANEEVFVWAVGKHEGGYVKGESIAPLHECVIHAVKEDKKCYEMLALVDAIRVGKAREHQLAIEELKQRIH